MSKVCLVFDYGHRITTPGKRTNCLPDRVIHERTFNEGYGSVAANLARANGCEVLEVAPDKNASMNEDADLNERIRKANEWYQQMRFKYNQDVVCRYISCHANAGGGHGAEVWIWHGAAAGGTEERDAKSVLNALCAATGMTNRGVKRGYPGEPTSDFAVNHYTTMPSMLVECGFMDYPAEADKMDKPDFWNQCGTAVWNGLAAALGIQNTAPTPSPEPSVPGELYSITFGPCTEGDKNDVVAKANALVLDPKATKNGKFDNGADKWFVTFKPMSSGDKATIEQMGKEKGVTVTSGRNYTVQPGDSWYKIAGEQLGDQKRASELAKYNGKTLRSTIHPGDVLKIPG